MRQSAKIIPELSLVIGQFCGSCTAVDAAHPIFNGPFTPVGTTFQGGFFSHGIVTGSFAPLIRDANGNALLAERAVGSGLALFGSMTTSNFHTPQPNADNLRRNIIAYAAEAADPDCFVVDATDDTFAVINDGTAASLAVLSNEECVDDEPISIVTQPGDLTPDRGGVAAVDGTAVLYTPAAGFVGFEEFSYTAQDAGLLGGEDPPSQDQDRARVVIEVFEDLLPNAIEDDVTTLQNQPIVVQVLANDVLGNPATALAIETGPTHGSVTIVGGDEIRYAPSFGFYGEDAFAYRLTDANGDTDVTTVTVGVFFVSGEIAVDVLPSDPGNNLNLRGGPGSGLDVAILSVGPFFDAPKQVDPLSLKLGPREANIWGEARARDVDADGDDDLLVKFLTHQTGIVCGDTTVELTGRTFDDAFVFGADAIRTFNCPRARRR